MTTAERLTTVAENVQKVYEAGKAAGGGGTVAVEEKDVNFYDYDGTLLYSYTLAEAQALTELPPGPKHDGLVFQGWNWDLEDVNALDQFMVIGANYITKDGKTRLYITLECDAQLTLPLHITQSVDASVEIDWGDGSAVETISGTGAVNTTHTYPQLGKYVIALNVTNGTLGLGGGTSATSLFGNEVYSRQTVTKIETGSNCQRFNSYCLDKCYRIETISVSQEFSKSNALGGASSGIICLIYPKGYYSSSAYALNGNKALRIVSYPKSQTHIPNSNLRECSALKYVALWRGANSTAGAFNYSLMYNHQLRRFDLPDKTNAIGTSVFDGCWAMMEFTVTRNVASIAATSLRDMYSLTVLRFLPTTPPAVANANAFAGIPTTCRVEVPAESLTAYQEATNYASLAAQMVGV